MFRRILFVALALVPFTLSAAPGTAKGTITINGKPKDLKFAYAWKDGANITVLLTDAKVDEQNFGNKFAMIDLARKGQFTGVQATITPKGDIPTGTIYTAAEDGYFDAMGMHEWKKSKQTASEISGKLSIDKEHKFFKTSYQYSADFTAPIGPEPKKK